MAKTATETSELTHDLALAILVDMAERGLSDMESGMQYGDYTQDEYDAAAKNVADAKKFFNVE